MREIIERFFIGISYAKKCTLNAACIFNIIDSFYRIQHNLISSAVFCII